MENILELRIKVKALYKKFPRLRPPYDLLDEVDPDETPKQIYTAEQLDAKTQWAATVSELAESLFPVSEYLKRNSKRSWRNG